MPCGHQPCSLVQVQRTEHLLMGLDGPNGLLFHQIVDVQLALL